MEARRRRSASGGRAGLVEASIHLAYPVGGIFGGPQNSAVADELRECLRQWWIWAEWIAEAWRSCCCLQALGRRIFVLKLLRGRDVLRDGLGRTGSRGGENALSLEWLPAICIGGGARFRGLQPMATRGSSEVRITGDDWRGATAACWRPTGRFVVGADEVSKVDVQRFSWARRGIMRCSCARRS